MLVPGVLDMDLTAPLAHFAEHGWARLGKVLADDAAEALRVRAHEFMLGTVVREGLFFQADSPTGDYAGLEFGKGWLGPSLAYRKIEKVERDPLYRAWIENPLFERINRAVIGDAISLFRAVLWTKSAEGGTDLPWHQDGGRFWGIDRDASLQIWTALDDAPLEGGCVRFVPGSHLAGLVGPDGGGVPEEALLRAKAEEHAVAVPVVAGEALLIHNLVWHRSGRNESGHPRRALGVAYLDAATKCTRKKHKPREFLRLFVKPSSP